MGKLSKEVLAEKDNVEVSLSNLKKVIKKKRKSVVELAAIGTFLHNIYNGIENILKQILKMENIEIPQTATWHKDLLKFSLSNGVISKKLSDELYKYLTFRHFFVHSYGFELDEAYLRNLTKDIPKVWSQFISEIEKSYLDE